MNFLDELKSAQSLRNLEDFGGSTVRHRKTFRQNQRKALQTILGEEFAPVLEVPEPLDVQNDIPMVKPTKSLIGFAEFVKMFFFKGYVDKYSTNTLRSSIFSSIGSNYLVFYKNYQFVINVIIMTVLLVYSILRDQEDQDSGVHYLWVFVLTTIVSPLVFWVFWSQFINLEYLEDLSNLMV